MKKREKRVAYILRAGMTVLTIILIILFFGIMSLVSDLQGTARVVNYAGLVRGEPAGDQTGNVKEAGRRNDSNRGSDHQRTSFRK